MTFESVIGVDGKPPISKVTVTAKDEKEARKALKNAIKDLKTSEKEIKEMLRCHP